MRKNVGNPAYTVPDRVLLSGLLRELAAMFSNNGPSLSSYDVHPHSELAPDESSNRLILEELAYDRTALAAKAVSMSLALNIGQRAIYDAIIDSVPTTAICVLRSWSWRHRENIPLEVHSRTVKV